MTKLRLKELDGCAVPKPLYPILRKLKADVPDLVYNSVYRGDDAAAILHRNGKHTQRELYDGFVRGLPGFLPANPPDRGTHILIGDGTVGRLFQKLKFWQCGIDVNDDLIEKVIEAARKHGWELYQPYPSGSEFHHLNFRKRPSRWKAFFYHYWPKRKKHRAKHHA